MYCELKKHANSGAKVKTVLIGDRFEKLSLQERAFSIEGSYDAFICAWTVSVMRIVKLMEMDGTCSWGTDYKLAD
jgi:hypothetical protein